MKFTETTMQEALEKYYDNQASYLVRNIYCFHSRYGETDLLVVKAGNKLCYDIEIKVSRGDFSADTKKVDKHMILEKGFYKRNYTTFQKGKGGKRKRTSANKPINTHLRPNRFYFAVPEGMVEPSELPEYAGLLFVTKSGKVTKVREAKLLHKKKLNIEKILCRKFYFRLQNCNTQLEIVKKLLKNCKSGKK